ncbi:endonuclease domain-containing protein [Micromonospora chalcea]|uniref:endonuclease domain-containing protein n=1 Tax=Micromonospora chalcea TaxID=1874 RepID=UPI003CF0AF7B
MGYALRRRCGGGRSYPGERRRQRAAASAGCLRRVGALARGRCAVCGQGHTVGRLVRDHDHASGLIRGLLCSSCNTAEGRTDSLLFNNYRRRPPSVILGIEVLYLPAGFKPGTHHLGVPAR